MQSNSNKLFLSFKEDLASVCLKDFLFNQAIENPHGKLKVLLTKKFIDYQLVNLKRKNQALVLLQDLSKVRKEEKSNAKKKM